jgi:hypothetical protein
MWSGAVREGRGVTGDSMFEGDLFMGGSEKLDVEPMFTRAVL